MADLWGKIFAQAHLPMTEEGSCWKLVAISGGNGGNFERKAGGV